MKRNIAVILAGCGVFDGSEIHEATLSLLAIARQGAQYQIFAPDRDQAHVINHYTGETTNEQRNILVESARIARGQISPLTNLNLNEFDAILFPGGFGVAKNLCTLAFEGASCSVLPEVEQLIHSAVQAGKPIGALCIAPAMMAKVLEGAQVTIGQDAGTIQAINAMGGKHIETNHAEIVIDKQYRLVSTPCYMLDANIEQIADGAHNLVTALLDMCN